MKRSIIFVLVCVSLLTSAAEEKAFVKGDKLVNGQIGAGVIGVTGEWGRLLVPPLIAGIEYGFTDFLSGGLSAGLAGSKDVVSKDYDLYYKYYLLMLAGRLNFHFFGLPGIAESPTKAKIDPYVGALIGWDFVRAKQAYPAQYPYNVVEGYQLMQDRLQWGLYGGLRYYVMPQVGVFCEAGASFGFFSIGATWKF